MGPGAEAWGYPTERPLSRSPYERYVALYDCWWALFGNRAAENNNEGHSVY